jgi:xanthine/CO dehydrogenase XdhC/CoxF family maturation factor
MIGCRDAFSCFPTLIGDDPVVARIGAKLLYSLRRSRMNKQLLERAAELARRGESFALAVVVRRGPYSSSQRGDMAIITADGSYGWLGGNCTRPQVQREAAAALVDGKPRLISLSPEPEQPARAGVTPLAMTCHSGGTVDIFIEPVLAAARLVVFGVSPVARAVAQLGKAMGTWSTSSIPRRTRRSCRTPTGCSPTSGPRSSAPGRRPRTPWSPRWASATRTPWPPRSRCARPTSGSSPAGSGSRSCARPS